MSIELPVSWSAEDWPIDLTLPALTVEDFVGQLRSKGAALHRLDPQLLQVAAFSYYCGSVAGGGHIDFICNNEADFMERILLAERGAHLLGLASIASVLQDFRALLPSGNIVDVYTAMAGDDPKGIWTESNGEMVTLSALDERLFGVKVGPAEWKMLSGRLSGAAKEGFVTAIASSKHSATNPQYVCLYAWLAGYAHLDFGTFKEATEKTARIAGFLSGN